MSTSLAKCRKCGKLFPRERGDTCPPCRTEELRVVERVRNYLDLHKDAGLGRVAEKTGVDPDEILRLAKEGLISAGEYTHVRYPCEVCQEPIATGRFCKKCNSRLADEFEKTVENMKNTGQTR